MGAMKEVFIQLAEEIYYHPRDNRWKIAWSNFTYTWEQAQQQAYIVVNKFGTEEVISKMGLFEDAEYSKNHPTNNEWEKKWDEKREEDLKKPSGPSPVFVQAVLNTYGPINQSNRKGMASE